MARPQTLGEPGSLASAAGCGNARRWLTVVAIVVAVAALGFTEWRLWQGMDLADESFYVVVPYRFSVGARPFVDEVTFLQVPAFLTYPLVKPFVALQGGEADGIIMYMRHLYLLYVIGVAAAVFFAVRRFLRWELGLLIAAIYLTYVLFELPQLSYNTLGAGFLTLGVSLGLLGLTPRQGGDAASWAHAHAPGTAARRWPAWIVCAGMAHGLAGFAYPTLWAMVFLFAVSLAVCVWLRLRWSSYEGSRRGWWRAVLAYSAGAALVAIVEAATLLSFGWSNVSRSMTAQLATARELDQLSGWDKVGSVLRGFARLVWSRPYLLVATLLLYLVYRRWPRLGRGLLVLLPLPLFLAGERDLLKAPGFIIMLTLLTPYLFLFVPGRVRRPATVLLIWAWLPALAAGVLSAWTSAEGYPHAALGMMPAVMAAAVYLSWSLLAIAELSPNASFAKGLRAAAPPLESSAEARGEAVTEREREAGAGASLESLGEQVAHHGVLLATIAVVGLVACCIVYQFQYLPRYVPYCALDAWMSSGPYWGIHTTTDRKMYLQQFERDLDQNAVPRDRLFLYPQFPGAYLFWPYRTATAGAWLAEDPDSRALPLVQRRWMREHHTVPSLFVRFTGVDGLTDAKFQQEYGGQLGYRIVLRRPKYTFLRRPPGSTPSFMRGP